MNGRVALVTGGGRGIGREAALLLAAAGARVMIVSRSATELATVGLEYTSADLGTAEGCARAVAETERRLGPVDVLVVNHGIGSAHEKLVWEQDPEVWRETMRINLDGPFELARLKIEGRSRRRLPRWHGSASNRQGNPAGEDLKHVVDAAGKAKSTAERAAESDIERTAKQIFQRGITRPIVFDVLRHVPPRKPRGKLADLRSLADIAHIAFALLVVPTSPTPNIFFGAARRRRLNGRK